MTQETQKNNTVLILIAIIGVVGTIVATTIGVIGNYNIEKFRQESELTRVALVSIVTQGGATQVSMASTISAPTSTSYPTESPFPKDTNTPTPIPTQTPDPRLFWDDFENGIKSEWGMTGENFLSANGKLVSNGHLEGLLGDSSWTNYKVTFNNPNYGSGNKITLFMRWQDRDNHMKMVCYNHVGGNWKCDWFKVVGGQEQLLAGTPHDVGYGKKNWQIEVDKNGVYRMIADGEVKFRFVDSTFSNGGIKLMLDKYGTFELDSFEVIALLN